MPEKHARFRMHEMDDKNESNRGEITAKVGLAREVDTALPVTVIMRYTNS